MAKTAKKKTAKKKTTKKKKTVKKTSGKKTVKVASDVAFDTQAQAAAYAGVVVKTIYRWVQAGKLCKKTYKSKQVYLKADIDELLKEQRDQEVLKNKAELIKAETQFKQARAKRADHQLQQELKNYVHIDEVNRQNTKKVLVLKKALLGMGNKVTPLIIALGLPRKYAKPVKKIFDDNAERMIRDFADGYDGSA